MARSRTIYDGNNGIQTLFENYNREYFNNRIKNVKVKWSTRLTTTVGTCIYNGDEDTYINLSLPILSLRPQKDLTETLLHEMIHAYLYIVDGGKEVEEHGPKFMRIMNRINKNGNMNITITHDFFDEVTKLKIYCWRCSGQCYDLSPKYGEVRRSVNRPPGPSEPWWLIHNEHCKGKFRKVDLPRIKSSPD